MLRKMCCSTSRAVFCEHVNGLALIPASFSGVKQNCHTSEVGTVGLVKEQRSDTAWGVLSHLPSAQCLSPAS